MIVIRRMVDKHRAYTAIFLKGEPAKVFPTSDQEHSRILQIFKQDRSYDGILDDFSDLVATLKSEEAGTQKSPPH